MWTEEQGVWTGDVQGTEIYIYVAIFLGWHTAHTPPSSPKGVGKL